METSGEDIRQELLKYLKEKGPLNTFRLSSKFGITRDRLLAIAKDLEKNRAIKFERGNVVFLRFPRRESVEIKRPAPKPIKQKKKIRRARARKKLHIAAAALEENKSLKERLQGLEASQARRIRELKEKIKELEQKAAKPARIIRRTIVKKIMVRTKKTAPKQKRLKLTFKKIRMPKLRIRLPKVNLLNKAIKKIQRFRVPGV